MKSKFEIGYIVKIKSFFDQSVFNNKTGVVISKRLEGPTWIYIISVTDNIPYYFGSKETNCYEYELVETKANIRDRKLKEIGI